MKRISILCRRSLYWVLVLPLLFPAASGRADAQGMIRKQVLSSGGRSDGTGGSFLLSGTVGQPFVGGAGAADSRLIHGFWQPRPMVSAVPTTEAVTGEVEVLRSYPNPFDEAATISYSLPDPGNVSIRVFDMSGGLVRVLVDGARPGGIHQVVWDGLDLSGEPVSTGSYLITLDAVPIDGARGTRIAVRRMVTHIR